MSAQELALVSRAGARAVQPPIGMPTLLPLCHPFAARFRAAGFAPAPEVCKVSQ